MRSGHRAVTAILSALLQTHAAASKETNSEFKVFGLKFEVKHA